MHALKIDDETRVAVLSPGRVRVGAFLEGLYRACRERHDDDTSHDIVNDTHQLVSEAGFGPLEQIGFIQLAQVIFSSTREWEYIGQDGTIDLVREQRDYTRSIVGEANFWFWYAGLDTIDGRSYHAPIQ